MFGGLGVDPCSRDPASGVRKRPQASASVRNHSQPSATVRLRPSWPQSCRAYGKSCKKVPFWRVRRCGHVVLHGRRGTSWHSNMFHNVSKVVLSGEAQYLCEVFTRCVAFFRGRRSTVKTSHVILCGRRSTLDVSCCVFSANRIVSAARSGDKVQIPWQAWHFVTCHENRRKSRTRGRLCSRSIGKLVGKRSFWRCEVWKLPG